MAEIGSEHRGGYETRDLNIKGVAVFVVALVLTLICVHFVVLATLRFYISRESQPPPLSYVKGPPAGTAGPGLLVDAPRLLRSLREQEDQALNTSGWVDRGRGIVRIPIDRAMDLIVRRGLPAKISEPGGGLRQ
jgi:hypothetical protein